jgi:hypothetical protein
MYGDPSPLDSLLGMEGNDVRKMNELNYYRLKAVGLASD